MRRADIEPEGGTCHDISSALASRRAGHIESCLPYHSMKIVDPLFAWVGHGTKVCHFLGRIVREGQKSHHCKESGYAEQAGQPAGCLKRVFVDQLAERWRAFGLGESTSADDIAGFGKHHGLAVVDDTADVGTPQVEVLDKNVSAGLRTDVLRLDQGIGEIDGAAAEDVLVLGHTGDFDGDGAQVDPGIPIAGLEEDVDGSVEMGPVEIPVDILGAVHTASQNSGCKHKGKPAGREEVVDRVDLENNYPGDAAGAGLGFAGRYHVPPHLLVCLGTVPCVDSFAAEDCHDRERLD